VFNTDPGDPVFFQLTSPFDASVNGITYEWWQYTPNYGGGTAERISTFGVCEKPPTHVFTTVPGNEYAGLGSRVNTTTYNNTYAGVFGMQGTLNYGITTITGNPPATNTWNHYAVVYNPTGSGSVSLYVNGVLSGSVSGSDSRQKPTIVNYVQIMNANFSTISNSVNNNILVSAFRVSNNRRYTSDFTPAQILTNDGTTIFFTKFVRNS
jgi:hypothetical protein